MKPLRFFLLSNIIYFVLTSYIYVKLNSTVDVLLYTLIHFFLASITNTILLNKILNYNICIVSSPVTSFTIITQVYFTFSSLKYFADNSLFYPMFEITKFDQFVGSLLGFIVVFFVLKLLSRSYFVAPISFSNWAQNKSKLILIVSFFLFLISLLIKIFLIRKGYGSTYSNSLFTKLELRQRNDAIILNLNEIVDQFVIIYFFLLNQIYRIKSSNRFLRFLTLFLVIIFFSYNLIFFKSRLLILFFILILIFFTQAFQPKRGILSLCILLILLPVTVGIFPMFNWLLGRENLMSDSFEVLIQITSYRADLTDYAYAILKKSNFIGLNLDIFTQGFVNAIPNLLFPGKDIFVIDAYSIGLEKIGWQAKSDTSLEIIDYQDSLFSAGAMTFGIIGFIFIPIIYIRILDFFARYFGRKSDVSFNAFLIFPLIISALKIELEFSNIFINIRNSIQMIFFFILFIFIFRSLIVRKNLN
jgi:hypothetical protein